MGTKGSGVCDRREFKLRATGCAHAHTDKGWGRLSLADAITDGEDGGDEGGQSFNWDIMVHLGDLKGNKGTPCSMIRRRLPGQKRAEVNPKSRAYLT